MVRKRNWSKKPVLLGVLLAFQAGADIQTTTQGVSANISPTGKISVPAIANLQAINTRFGNLAGSLTVSYWARTSDGGGGSVTVQADSDFSPSGGPTVGAVNYTCSGATLGVACSGTQTLNASTQTSLVSLPTSACTGGGGTCSTQDPNTVQMTFSAPNRPHFRTGTYSAHIIFTISTL